jgi:hypothetical protein
MTMITVSTELDKDELYWQLRQENDQFLERQRWWWKHMANGILKSQAQRERQRLAREAEQLISGRLALMGYQVNPTTHKCPFDLWVADDQGRAVRVEVKISLYSQASGRYQANIRHDQAELLVFIARNGRDWVYVIPMGDVTPRHHIAIWSYCPGDYTGRWAAYLEAWEYLRQALEQANPQSYQLPLL